MKPVHQMTPQELAEASTQSLWNGDSTSQRLGVVLESVAPGVATLTMTVTDAMSNGHGACHGGYIFTLADSAFAFACNSYNQHVVGQHCSITYLMPVRLGDQLTAIATEKSRQGRSGIYDVRITNQDGAHVAEFRGHSRTVKGTHLPVDL
ncbi:MAG: hydroxyphenylacetyl-CoA thioesterase PaaI [Paracoccaceae bacterium]